MDLSSQSEGQQCYFCKDLDTKSALIRSLYHKHSDISDKQLKIIDTLITNKKSSAKVEYEELVRDTDKTQKLNKYWSRSRSYLQQLDLLEYYKYRKYVPIFARSPSTDTIYTYYYERLKRYYNSIKRRLNMTVEPSDKTQRYLSELSANSTSNCKNTQILKEMSLKSTEKLQIEEFETQSKALKKLVSILQQNQSFKKVKTLKTEDCYLISKDPFSDQKQRKDSSSHNHIFMKRNNGVFLRFIPNHEQTNITKVKGKESTVLETEKKNGSWQKSKSRKEIVSYRDKTYRSKSMKRIYDQERIRQSKSKIRSLPKVLMEFQIKSTQSLSSLTLKNTQNINKKILLLKKQPSNVISPYESYKKPQIKKESMKNESRNSLHKKVKADLAKTIKQTGFQFQKDDNIINIKHKKIELLKLKGAKSKRNNDK